jgi:hypothetical protein
MKNILVLFLCAIFCTLVGYSQNIKDTTKKHENVIEKRIIVTSDVSGDEDIVFDSDCQMGEHNMMNESCGPNCKKMVKFKKGCNKSQVSGIQCQVKNLGLTTKLFILMPVILLAFFFLIILFWLRRENFKLSDAITSRQVEIIKTTHSHTDPNDPTKTIKATSEEAFYPKSSSRLLALLAGFSAIILAACTITYIAYFSVKLCTPPPHLGGLWIVFFLLGIGMIPYAIKTMFKK